MISSRSTASCPWAPLRVPAGRVHAAGTRRPDPARADGGDHGRAGRQLPHGLLFRRHQPFSLRGRGARPDLFHQPACRHAGFRHPRRARHHGRTAEQCPLLGYDHRRILLGGHGFRPRRGQPGQRRGPGSAAVPVRRHPDHHGNRYPLAHRPVLRAGGLSDMGLQPPVVHRPKLRGRQGPPHQRLFLAIPFRRAARPCRDVLRLGRGRPFGDGAAHRARRHGPQPRPHGRGHVLVVDPRQRHFRRGRTGALRTGMGRDSHRSDRCPRLLRLVPAERRSRRHTGEGRRQ